MTCSLEKARDILNRRLEDLAEAVNTGNDALSVLARIMSYRSASYVIRWNDIVPEEELEKYDGECARLVKTFSEVYAEADL